MKPTLTAIKIFLLFTVLTGFVYPMLITVISQSFFPEKANGSLIKVNNKVIGSELIGQKFDSSIYFSSRPSATDYNSMPSGASNYSITNARLKEQVINRKRLFISENYLDTLASIPSEMLFESASGLDPHISPEAAILQVNRICKARNYDENKKEKLIQLIKKQTETPQLLFLGESRINVLLLNLSIDSIK